MLKYPYPYAVPSWVINGDIQENILFLHDKVKEVELLCFEPSLPCLDNLPQTTCSWHIHLPSSVPMDFFEKKKEYRKLTSLHEYDKEWGNPWTLAKDIEDIAFFATVCVEIFNHCQKLAPWLGVLHLPPSHQPMAKAYLAEFLEYWKYRLPLKLLALENVRNAALHDFSETIFHKNYEQVQLCLDVAHALSFEQRLSIENQALMDKVALIHWSAPCPSAETDDSCRHKDMHLALYHLESERAFCEHVVEKTPSHVTHVIEVFNWQGVEDSVPFLDSLTATT